MFENPITGLNGVLIRKQIQSANFVTGVSGWIIRQDGSAEFNSATFRGNVTITQSNDLLVYSTAAPALNKLVLAIAGSAGNDGLGNSWQQGLSIWDGNGVLIGNWGTGGFELINNANAAKILIQATNTTNRTPRIFFQPNSALSSVNGFIEANSFGPIDALLMVGPVAIVGTDPKASSVGIQLQTATGADAAQGQLFWQDNTPSSAGVLKWDGGGARLTPGSISSIRPGTSNPAQTEGWHTLSLNAGYTTAPGLVTPRYQFESINGGRVRLNGGIQLTANKAANSIIGTLPAGYIPINQQSFNCPNNLSGQVGLGTSLHIDTSGNVVHEPAGSTNNVIILDDVVFPID